MKVNRIVTGSYLENTYLIFSEDMATAVILDPGVMAMQKIRPFLQRQTRVEAIFITHPHIDHIYDLKLVKDETGAEIYMHFADLPILADYKADADVIAYRPPPPPPGPDRYWEDGDRIELGGLSFEIIHTPGHTPGSVCIRCESGIFTGDTLMNGAIGQTGNPDQYAELMDSIRTKLLSLPDDTIIFPGHLLPSTIGKEKQCNFELY
ncbi:MAG TPA: MBL fold metallo-hydrolase [Flavilitoribacter sp.]|nr:MBL fold metallo-hydrolase [Flavilitoribacter sp.]HMQ89927.1 MBL fold metallo-hydrolase [Flavilitoribacter sp.]